MNIDKSTVSLTPSVGPSAISKGHNTKLEKAAKELESVFLKQLLDAMDKTVDREESMLSGGHAEEMFRGMLNEHVALSWSKKTGGSGLGLAEHIYKQLERQAGGPDKLNGSSALPKLPSA
jgi:Rod binding domain-containing protein